MTVYDLKTMQICEIRENTVVALGFFDGCHAGHAAVFASCRALAHKMGAKSAVYTFSTLPKNKDAKCIFSLDERIKAIRKSGVDYLCIEDFESVMDLDASEFLEGVLCEKLHAVGACCGFNFKFGKGAVANASDLAKFFQNRGGCVNICDKILHRKSPLSSSLLRSFIEKGELEALCEVANPYSIYAIVEHGKELGRTIGIPTINQKIPQDKIVPARGVYITECEIGEDVYPSITNVGVRPSVDENGQENIETHIIGFSGNLYGSGVRVNFYKKIRDEKKFESIALLKKEIEKNIQASIEFFK